MLLQRKLFEESQPAPSCMKIKATKEPKVPEKPSALPDEGIKCGNWLVGEKRGECSGAFSNGQAEQG